MNRTVSVLLFVALTAVAVSATGPEATYKAPRTEDGRPDLRGVWNFRIELSFPMALVHAGIFESACHEGNYSLTNTLSAVRKEEAAKKPQ